MSGGLNKWPLIETTKICGDIHTCNLFQKLYDLKVAHMPWESLY